MSVWGKSTGDIIGPALRGEMTPANFGEPPPRPIVHRRFAEPLLAQEQWEALEKRGEQLLGPAK